MCKNSNRSGENQQNCHSARAELVAAPFQFLLQLCFICQSGTNGRRFGTHQELQFWGIREMGLGQGELSIWEESFCSFARSFWKGPPSRAYTGHPSRLSFRTPRLGTLQVVHTSFFSGALQGQDYEHNKFVRSVTTKVCKIKLVLTWL